MDDEEELVRRAQEGEHEAFLGLLARYDRQVMSVVYRFSCDQVDREDLYQEVFLHAFRSLHTFRFRSSFATWLYRVALNRCAGLLRKRRPVLAPVDAPAPPVDWERRHKLAAVHAALGRLRGPQRLAFHLHYVEGWELDRIAELLRCREGTVKSHLHRARQKIRGDREILRWQTEG